MDSPGQVKKVHDIYPDPDAESGEDPTDSVMGDTQDSRRPSVNGPINHARPRPIKVPRPISQSYPAFKGKQQCALKISIHGLPDCAC
jgi:hypothetical protein